MSDENWTTEELKAAVEAYVEMRNKEANREKFTKKTYYEQLSASFDRTSKSFEYRMQNISYVYSLMGRPWVNGLKPAKNVGARVTKEIEKLIQEIEGQCLFNSAEFEAKVLAAKNRKNSTPPPGRKAPAKSNTITTQYQRDPEVVAWILEQAAGACEACGENAPFQREDETPYLEVHHLRMLADGGSDTTTNTIALCPNCHREFHYGRNKKVLAHNAILKIHRLVAE